MPVINISSFMASKYTELDTFVGRNNKPNRQVPIRPDELTFFCFSFLT
jgi:hypothetical protein